MINLLNRYFINYFIWWYFVQAKAMVGKVLETWIFILNILNVGPMLKNLFQPLYQDYSRMGRLIAFPIRLTWVLFGTLVGAILLFLFIGIIGVYLMLPIMPLYGVISYMSNI